ncbi:LysR family transcriptional regulator [Streptosporangium sp. CA-135522]|uniref:LysR family transcriptional regulator n=1 Tax=Streptosporangium sp. CA-135522 TaxID=3240072 RepID=UPI003D92E89B
MEMRDIEIFLTLAEELHFGCTAERLHVSPARVSQAIRKQERLIGGALFERSSRSVRLTPVGEKLLEDLRPAYEQIQAGLKRATDASRGVSGTLRIGFVSAAAGQLLVQAAARFNMRHPDCEVQIREAQISVAVQWLRIGEVDLLVAAFPLRDPDLVMGPVLMTEPRLLAVSAGHPFARCTSVSLEDLARDKVIQAAGAIPDSWREDRTPRQTPSGRPIEPGPSADTFQEILALVSAGQGVFPVGEQARLYYARPDIVYVPFNDAKPLKWGLIWRAKGVTARMRAFVEAAG